MRRQKIEVAGTAYRVTFGAAADLVEYPDGETELVYDLEAWIEEQQPTTDGGREPFDGVCSMCGSTYDSYMSHLQRCEPR